MPLIKDLTGKRFGRLLVLKRAQNHIYPSGRTRTKWECKCDCGVIKTVLTNVLQQGDALSCGCLALEVRTTHGKSRNKEFLKDYRKDHYKRNKDRYRERSKKRYNEKRDEILAYAKDYRAKNRMKRYVTQCRRYCKNKELPFNLTEEYLQTLWESQKGRCAVTGIIMEPSPKGRSPISISLDRINPNEGYTINNVRFICDVVNIMKQQYTDNELLKWCKRIINGLNANTGKEILIPNYNTLSDICDRLIVEVSKLSWYENTKREESMKENPDIELIVKLDRNSRDCCEFRDILKRKIDSMIEDIVLNNFYGTLNATRTFKPPSKSISELLEDMSYSAPKRVRTQLAKQFSLELSQELRNK